MGYTSVPSTRSTGGAQNSTSFDQEEQVYLIICRFSAYSSYRKSLTDMYCVGPTCRRTLAVRWSPAGDAWAVRDILILGYPMGIHTKFCIAQTQTHPTSKM